MRRGSGGGELVDVLSRVGTRCVGEERFILA